MKLPRVKAWPARTGPALLLVAVGACQDSKALPEKPAVRVQAQRVDRTDYAPTVKLTGDIRAHFQSDLSFRVSGRVTERNVEVGHHVEADDIIARLDPEEQRANLSSAEAGVKAAQAQYRLASSAFERQKTLLARGYTTRRDFDQAEEAIRVAEGTLDSAKAQLATAQDQLAQTMLLAGAAGVITSRRIEVGQVVQTAQPVFSLAHDGALDAVFAVQESVFDLAPADNVVEVSLLADPKIRAKGVVREVAPTVDPGGGTIRVKVGLGNPPAAMKLGSAVIGEGRFKRREVIILPWRALFSDHGHHAVWTVDPQTDTVSLRRVAVERYESGSFVVRDGLKLGDIVVTAGAQLLRPGQPVSVANGSP